MPYAALRYEVAEGVATIALDDPATRNALSEAVLGELLEAVHVLRGLFHPPRQRLLAFAGAAAYWAGDGFCLWAALQCFGPRLGIAQLVVGYATGYALTRRALPLGGAGVVEALLPFALGWLGIALLPALLAVFAYRLINLWLPMIPALAGLPALRTLEAAAPARRKVPARA